VAVPFTNFPNTISGTYTNTFDLTAAGTYNSTFLANSGGTAALAESVLITGLETGLAYTNIHDAEFPAGEIRGQLAAVPEPTT
jgi:CHRD domain-containing protein